MTHHYTKIRLERHHDGAVWRVLLDSPKGNVLDSTMMGDIHEMLDDAKLSKEIRLIVYEGAGKHFSFGASVEEHTKDRAAGMLQAFHGMFYRMADLAIPTAALVRGQCLGGGMELAIFTNFLFAESTAAFGQPEIKLGVLPPPASIILPLKVGQANADLLALAGGSVDARRAYEMGLVTHLVPEGEDGWAHVSAWAAEHVAPLSGASLRRACAAVRSHFNEVLRTKLSEVERLYLADLMETHDANEGIASFLEKRKPVWTHD
jgi:cyclohexa-1,5-dienecarbonyl-CoA hydratase